MKNSTVANISIIVLVIASLVSMIDFSPKQKLIDLAADNSATQSKPQADYSVLYLYGIGLAVFVALIWFILARTSRSNVTLVPEKIIGAEYKKTLVDYNQQISALHQEYYKKAMELRSKYGVSANYQELRAEYQKKIFDLHNKHQKMHGANNKQNLL